MAKVAAPKEKVEKDKKKNQQQRGRTIEDRDEYLANAMLKANETMAMIRGLASNAMPIPEAKEAKAKMKKRGRNPAREGKRESK